VAERIGLGDLLAGGVGLPEPKSPVVCRRIDEATKRQNLAPQPSRGPRRRARSPALAEYQVVKER